MPPLWVDHAAHRPKDLLGMRDGGPAMTAALRIETAAGATTGQVLASGKVNQWSGNLPDQTQRARARAAGISVRTQRKLDRLARDRPDLLAEVKAGRMSAHRAALEAGIVGKATEDERAGSPDAPDRPPWHAIREALNRLVGCLVPAEHLARTVPFYRVARMAANARRASQLLAVLAARLDERTAALAIPKQTSDEEGNGHD
jgi:hypothetical protein